MEAPPAHGARPAGDEDPAAGSPEPDDLPHDEVVAWEPVVTRPDPMTQEDQQALLDAVTDQDAPWWLEEGDPDPQDDDPTTDTAPGNCTPAHPDNGT